MGKSPAPLFWPGVGPQEGYSEQELCSERCLLGGSSSKPLGRTLWPLL